MKFDNAGKTAAAGPSAACPILAGFRSEVASPQLHKLAPVAALSVPTGPEACAAGAARRAIGSRSTSGVAQPIRLPSPRPGPQLGVSGQPPVAPTLAPPLAGTYCLAPTDHAASAAPATPQRAQLPQAPPAAQPNQPDHASPSAPDAKPSVASRSDRQEIRRLERAVATSMGWVARRGGTSFGSAGAAVLVGACTVAQPVMQHMPLFAGITMAVAGGLFVIVLLLGVALEAWCKTQGMRRLPHDVITDIESLYVRLNKAAQSSDGLGSLEEEKNLALINELVEQLLGGSWHALRVLAKHGAQANLSGPSYPPGALEAAWQKGQRPSGAGALVGRLFGRPRHAI